MNWSRSIKFLRVSYWAGAMFDAFVLIPTFSPNVAGVTFGIPNFKAGNDFRYGIHIAASLMPGWGTLLIWGDRKPSERKGVLLLKVIPVLAGIILPGVHAVLSGFISVGSMLPHLDQAGNPGASAWPQLLEGKQTGPAAGR